MRTLRRVCAAAAFFTILAARLSGEGPPERGAPVLSCGASSGAAFPQAMERVKAASFPELARVDIRTRSFQSPSDYLKTGFSAVRFLLPVRMRYYVKWNPSMFDRGVPENGSCAILAHELSHVVELSRGSRIRRLALVRLLSAKYTAGFERRTDLAAIERGYAEGLIAYRTWLYASIPAASLPAKRRNYFSPDEIAEVAARLRAQPEWAIRWRTRVPRSLEDVRSRAEPTPPAAPRTP